MKKIRSSRTLSVHLVNLSPVTFSSVGLKWPRNDNGFGTWGNLKLNLLPLLLVLWQIQKFLSGIGIKLKLSSWWRIVYQPDRPESHSAAVDCRSASRKKRCTLTVLQCSPKITIKRSFSITKSVKITMIAAGSAVHQTPHCKQIAFHSTDPVCLPTPVHADSWRLNSRRWPSFTCSHFQLLCRLPSRRFALKLNWNKI